MFTATTASILSSLHDSLSEWVDVKTIIRDSDQQAVHILR